MLLSQVKIIEQLGLQNKHYSVRAMRQSLDHGDAITCMNVRLVENYLINLLTASYKNVNYNEKKVK